VVERALRAERGGSPLTLRIRREAEKLKQSGGPGEAVRENDLVSLLSKRICRSMIARLGSTGLPVPAQHGTRRWELDTVLAMVE
jgi:hypothetical protein